MYTGKYRIVFAPLLHMVSARVCNLPSVCVAQKLPDC